MRHLFAMSFAGGRTKNKLAPIVDHLSAIDSLIQGAAPEWPLAKIAKVDLAVLRLAVYELTEVRTEPPKVIIDEAIELAKAYGNPTSPKFVNGVLGTILKNL